MAPAWPIAPAQETEFGDRADEPETRGPPRHERARRKRKCGTGSAAGRAKAWPFGQPNNAESKRRYAVEQRQAVLRALAAYAPQTMAVFDVDFGHTDPQWVIPYGGLVSVDGPARRITVTY